MYYLSYGFERLLNLTCCVLWQHKTGSNSCKSEKGRWDPWPHQVCLLFPCSTKGHRKDSWKEFTHYWLLNYLKPYLAWVVLGLTQVVFEFGQEVISDVSDCFGSVTGHRHLGAVRQDDVYGVVRLRAHGLGHRCGWRCRGVESLTTSFELNQVDQGKDLEPILGDALVEKEKNVEVQILPQRFTIKNDSPRSIRDWASHTQRLHRYRPRRDQNCLN